MAADWMETAEVAEVLNVSSAAVRKRIKRDEKALVAAGMVRKVDAPDDDGGHRRWQIQRSLVQGWRSNDATREPAKRDEVWRLREELELSGVESIHHAIAAKHATDELHRQQIETLESEIRTLRSQLGAAYEQVETLGTTVAALTRRAATTD